MAMRDSNIFIDAMQLAGVRHLLQVMDADILKIRVSHTTNRKEEGDET